MQTPIRIFSPFGFMNEVNRTYHVRLFSDEEDDFPPQVRNHTVDPRYVLRRVDGAERVNKIDYSMCVDTDDEKMC